MGKQFETRKKILSKYNQNTAASYSKIAKNVGVAKSTVQKVISNYKKTFTIERKVGSGKKAGPIDTNLANKVISAFKKNPSLSLRDVAKKCNTSKSYVHKVKQNRGFKSYKVTVAPDRDEQKNKIAKTRSRKLYENFLTKVDCVIMDDETYIKGDFKQMPGQNYYVAEAKGAVADRFRMKKLSKFPKKYLVWQAICSCGKKSKSFIKTGTIKQEIYIKECLQKCLLPFINEHDCLPLFWPDLASSHYAKATLEWYKANNLNFVPRQANPPNCPELRPIEKYWAIVKRYLNKTHGASKNEADFKRKWKKSMDKVTRMTVQRLMGEVKRKVKS